MAANMAPQAILPPPVQQVAQAGGFGAFTKAYIVTASLAGEVTTIILCFLGAIFCGFLAFEGVGTILTVAATLFLFGGSVYAVYQTVWGLKQQVYRFQQGIIVYDTKQVQSFPWRQTTEVREGITRHYRNGRYTYTSYRYTLQHADGYKVNLDGSLKDIEELGRAVVISVTQEQLPRAQQAIQAGQTLSFAKVGINLQGVGKGNEFLPWSHVQAIEVKKGSLIIKRGGKTKDWGLVEVIPNFFVFMTIAEEMMRRNANNGR
jgi:hypothetical protein